MPDKLSLNPNDCGESNTLKAAVILLAIFKISQISDIMESGYSASLKLSRLAVIQKMILPEVIRE